METVSRPRRPGPAPHRQASTRPSLDGDGENGLVANSALELARLQRGRLSMETVSKPLTSPHVQQLH